MKESAILSGTFATAKKMTFEEFLQFTTKCMSKNYISTNLRQVVFNRNQGFRGYADRLFIFFGLIL